MANPTTNFGWVMPTSTSLVTNLPADFNTFGQGVDTSMAQLKGGTTGQILSKTSATDMAFTWITNDVGDITAVNTTAPLAGGGTSGALTLSIASATTAVVGAVQLSDSTSTTSSVLAATPTAVKSAYDLADGAIAKSTVTTAGDVIYRNATVPTRLGIGTAGQVLTVNSGATAPEWATPAGGSTFVGVGLKKSAVQSISNATFTAVSWNLEDFDTTAYHDNTTNNTRITIPTGKAGYYAVAGAIQFAGNGTGNRGVELQKNGASVNYMFFEGTAAAANSPAYPMSYILNLAVGDYLELLVYQTSGGALNVETQSTKWQMQYLGA